MTKSEMKKILKTASRDELEGLLLAMHQQQPKERKPVYEISVKNYLNGQPIPDKKAMVPDLKVMDHALEQLESDGWRMQDAYGYIAPSIKRRMTKNLKELSGMFQHIPSEAETYPETLERLQCFFWQCQDLAEYDYRSALNVWAKIKSSEEDYFRFVLHRHQEQGLSRAVLLGMMEFSARSAANRPMMGVHLLKIFLASLKVGDVRFEAMELLEEFLADPFKVVLYAEPDHGLAFWVYILCLYILLAEEEVGWQAMESFFEERLDDALDIHKDIALEKVTDYKRITSA